MSEFESEKRSLWRFFETNDYERTRPNPARGITSGTLETHAFRSDRDRLVAWFHDSLLWTIEMVESNRVVEAFRGFVQAAGYQGALGGPPGPYAGDIFLRLRSWFEDEWRALQTERDLAMEIANDRLEELEVPFPARRLRR